MKRKPTSKIWRTALYLHRVCGRTTFTARDIHNAMKAAFEHSPVPTKGDYPQDNVPYYGSNLTHDQVSNMFKRGYLLRDETQHPFVYRINPDYLED